MSTALGWNLITLPSIPAAPASIEYMPTDIVGISRSTFTNGEQVFNYGMSYWRWSISMPLMPEPIAQPWLAFLMALQGIGNVFQIGDPRRQSPQGTGAGTPVVNGGSQTGYSLSTRGWTPGLVLKAGDYLMIGYRLYRATADVTYTSGSVSVPIWPNLRESPVDGASIATSNTKGLFRLEKNDRLWKISSQRVYSINFEAIEVINAVS